MFSSNYCSLVVVIIIIIIIIVGTGTGGLGNKRMSHDHPNYSIIKISQNTEKSPGDLRRLGVTPTQVRNHQQMLVGKTLKRVK